MMPVLHYSQRHGFAQVGIYVLINVPLLDLLLGFAQLLIVLPSAPLAQNRLFKQHLR
jgi:hypothetical protein